MNEAIAFDTHRFVKHLTETGFTEAQAEALAEEQVKFLNTNLVTKTDLARVEAALKTDIAPAKYDTIRWVIGAVAAVQTTLSASGAGQVAEGQ